jgi:hypothetical protein
MEIQAANAKEALGELLTEEFKKEMGNVEPNSTILAQLLDDYKQGLLSSVAKAMVMGDVRSQENDEMAKAMLKKNIFMVPLHLGLSSSVTRVTKDMLVLRMDEEQMPVKSFVPKVMTRWRQHLVDKVVLREAGDIAQALSALQRLAVDMESDAMHVEVIRALSKMTETVRAESCDHAFDVGGLWGELRDRWSQAHHVVTLNKPNKETELRQLINDWASKLTGQALAMKLRSTPRAMVDSQPNFRDDRGWQDGRQSTPRDRRTRSRSPERSWNRGRERDRERDRGRGYDRGREPSRGRGYERETRQGRSTEHGSREQTPRVKKDDACTFFNSGMPCVQGDRCRFRHWCSKCMQMPERRRLGEAVIGHPRFQCPLDKSDQSSKSGK